MSESDADQHVRSDDHVLGDRSASHTLLEYGSYACTHCRAADSVIREVREALGDDIQYVFRHKPLDSDPYAVPAAIIAEIAGSEGRFWEAHDALMRRPIRSDAELERIASDLGISMARLQDGLNSGEPIDRVSSQATEARNLDIQTVPSFFVDGNRYRGPWDEMSLLEAIDPPVAQRVAQTAYQFAGWAPVTGLVLAISALLALIIANSPIADSVSRFWSAMVGLNAGAWSIEKPISGWVNDALMSVFFLVVGLEIKREMTIGELSDWRRAVLPASAAVGGMVVPALIYVSLTWGTDMAAGWGVPMATDIAFSLGLLALLGKRVPIALKVFLTALAIIDDLGAILVIALFYGHGFYLSYALGAAAVFALLLGMNRAGVYHTLPYVVLGIALWGFTYASGLHATLAGILLAMAVPTRPPPNVKALLAQAEAIMRPEIEQMSGSARQFPSHEVVESLDVVHDRIESPAHRIERRLEPWSSFLILPLFAFVNAAIVLTGIQFQWQLSSAIILGLVIGKPLGIFVFSYALVRLKLAELPSGVTWPMVLGVGALAGIGFTMSIFIGNEAFPAGAYADSAKVAIMLASVASALVGLVVLSRSLPETKRSTTTE